MMAVHGSAIPLPDLSEMHPTDSPSRRPFDSSSTDPTRHEPADDRGSRPLFPVAPRILVADDQPDVLEALRLLLKAEGYHIETAASPAGILAAIEDKEYDVLVMDLNYARDTTSGQEGLDLLHTIRNVDPTLPVVVMTAWGSVDVAVEAMRRAASGSRPRVADRGATPD